MQLSKTAWYVIGGILVLLILAWIVTRGIGGAAMQAAGVNTTSGPGGATTYTDNQGNTATVGGNSMPQNWPSDAPANYAGGTITFSGSSNPQTGKPGSAVVYTTHATAQAVADYYKQQLSSSGWTISATANAGGATVLSATKDTRTFGLYIVDAGSGNVSVTAGIGM